MAKQVGPHYIQGKIGNYAYYKLGEDWIVRLIGSVSGKAFWKHPNFGLVRLNVGYFGQSSKLASPIYSTLPKQLRNRQNVWYPLKEKARKMLRQGKTIDEIMPVLLETMIEKLISHW